MLHNVGRNPQIPALFDDISAGCLEEFTVSVLCSKILTLYVANAVIIRTSFPQFSPSARWTTLEHALRVCAWLRDVGNVSRL
jgi:hypothetical protein